MLIADRPLPCIAWRIFPTGLFRSASKIAEAGERGDLQCRSISPCAEHGQRILEPASGMRLARRVRRGNNFLERIAGEKTRACRWFPARDENRAATGRSAPRFDSPIVNTASRGQFCRLRFQRGERGNERRFCEFNFRWTCWSIRGDVLAFVERVPRIVATFARATRRVLKGPVARKSSGSVNNNQVVAV